MEYASGLTYETVMPGGMSIASCRIPWDTSISRLRLNGLRFVVYHGTSIVWWGTLWDNVPTFAGADRKIELRAIGPWGVMAKRPFNQTYQSNGYTAADFIRAALWGNVEDVGIGSAEWDDPGIDLEAMSWSASNVQTVIAECLRFGDSSTSPWTFLCLPPKPTFPNTAGFTFYDDCSDTGSMTGTAGTAPVVSTGLYMRGGSCLRCAAPGGGSSRFYKDIGAGAANDQMVATAWIYVPNNRPNEAHQYITIYTGGGTVLASLRSDATHNLGLWCQATATNYYGASPTVLGAGCWHHVGIYINRNAVAGTLTAMLDGRTVVTQAGINTGAAAAQIVYWGTTAAGVAARDIYVDNVGITVGSATFPSMDLYNFDGGTLPETRIVKLDTSAYDLDISLNDIVGSYAMNQSLSDTVNQLDVFYGGTSYKAIGLDTTSVGRYGQLWKQETAGKITSGTTALYLRNRYLAQYKEPRYIAQSFTLTSPPRSASGSLYPLPLIRAGLRFRIREMPELGNIYIGQTQYVRGEPDQQEACQITPTGGKGTVDALLAGKVARGWT
jgi:hypothetical protein